MHELNTQVMLRVIDTRWMNTCRRWDHLKTGIGLRHGQRDPLVSTGPGAYPARSRCSSSTPHARDYCIAVLRIPRSKLPACRGHKEAYRCALLRPAEVDGDNGDSVLRKLGVQVQARTAVQGRSGCRQQPQWQR